MGLLVGTKRALLEGYPATRYYVDATLGNDANSGKSPDLAWETVAKVNAATFNPGESVLFKRGETFADDLTFAAGTGGTMGNPIICGAYGVGAIPNIHPTTSTAFEPVADLHDMVFNNLYFEGDDNPGLYVGAAINPNRLIFNNCEFDGSDSASDSAGIYSGTDIAFNSCKFYNSEGQGKTGLQLDNMTDVQLVDCESYDNGTDAAIHQGYYIADCTNVTLLRCISHDNAAHGLIIDDGCVNVIANRCLIYDNGNRGVEFHGLAVGSNNVVKNSIIHSNVTAAGACGIYVDSDVNSASLLSCTIVNNRVGMYLDTGFNACTFKNNIILQDAVVLGEVWSDVCIFVVEEDDLANSTFDNNCEVYDGSGDGRVNNVEGAGKTFAAWQALGAAPDPNGIGTNPDFVTDYTDFHLLVGSDCIGAGAVGTGVTEDYDGVTRGSPPDIGAYEYVA